MTEEARKRFLISELRLLTVNAALSTRTEGYPIYADGKKLHQRGKEKEAIHSFLAELEQRYATAVKSEEEHIKYIEATARDLSQKLGASLHGSRFRIGIAQKLINLHLKYLWVADLGSEPFHCPIDGTIRDIAHLDYDWTTNDDINDYRSAISQLKKFSNGTSLAVWELHEFSRRQRR